MTRFYYWAHPDVLAVGYTRDAPHSKRREVRAQSPGASFSRVIGWRTIGEIEQVTGGWRTGCCGRVFSLQRDAASHIAWAGSSSCDEARDAERRARMKLTETRKGHE
jgi:hypothetical protein